MECNSTEDENNRFLGNYKHMLFHLIDIYNPDTKHILNKQSWMLMCIFNSIYDISLKVKESTYIPNHCLNMGNDLNMLQL